MVEIALSLLLALFAGTPSWAEGGCPIEGCSQSHVSTTGADIFSLGCTAQFANQGCNGQPLLVATNTCVDADTLEAFWAEKDDGKELPAGSCGPVREVREVSCRHACAQQGYAYGHCHMRQVLCFGGKRKVGYCFCQ